LELQQILIGFRKFSCNSIMIVSGYIATSGVIMLFCPLLDV